MRWREAIEPTRMDRVAVVAPADRLRQVLVAVADAGVVQLERIGEPGPGPAGEALERARRQQTGVAPGTATAVPRLLPDVPDVAALERTGRLDELAGEAELERTAAVAVQHGAVAGLVGWAPRPEAARLADRLAPIGGAVVRIARPAGVDPPTQVPAAGATGAFQPLVDTYATVPYADLNPSVLAGLAYVVMFGMMFGDVGHGLLLFAGGVLLWRARRGPLAAYRKAAPFVIGAGIASTAFGFAYGEAFGPTGLVRALWLEPMQQPVTLLLAGVAAGMVLLTISYAYGTVNRWREAGPLGALVAFSGLAGSALYAGLALIAAGWLAGRAPLTYGGIALSVAASVLGYAGLYVETPGHAAGAFEAGVELFDTVIRLGANTISFARLAAFGLTHAALGGIVWSGTVAFAARGGAWWLVAALVFTLGNALAFVLEALVAGIQALRLDYYELFSRIFITTGRPFRPWHTALPTEAS